MKGWTALAAACCLAVIGTGGASAVIAGQDRALSPGDEGTVVTVLEGNRTREIPVTFIGTYHDFGGPGYDIHLVQLEGPDAERIGVASGMSGSPVYFDGEMIGALSYRLGFLPKTAVGGVTPIENMLDAAREDSPVDADGSGIRPIATPVIAGALSAGARGWLSPRLAELGLELSAAGSGGSTEIPGAKLGPGSPVGVELIRGDMRMAATGTVTRVDGDRVYAFGHPFLGTGRVEMPMVAAEVIHTLADLAGSVKLANVGQELGAVVEDRRAAIVGRVGQKASMIPIEVKLRGGDYGRREYRFEVVESADLAPVLAAVSVLSALQADPGYSREATLMARGVVRMRELPDLQLEMAVAGAGGADASISVATELAAILGALWQNPFSVPHVEGLDLVVDARREIVRYWLEDVHYDREPVRPGQQLTLECLLRPYRGEPFTQSLTLTLPESLPRGEELGLVVGNPRAIDNALGQLLSRRFYSAADPASYVRVLSDLYAPHRLMAVVVERGGAVVAGGDAYFRLPPTAERLLATQSQPSRRNRSGVSPLARAETNLDGPVAGTRQFRVTIGSAGVGEAK